MTDLSRTHALELDATDPIAHLRDRFVLPETGKEPLLPGAGQVNVTPELIYLDGNSLGRLPRTTLERTAQVVRDEWSHGLIRGGSHWVELPVRTGDLIGRHLVGAAPGQVVVSDSTTVNLYKLAVAALDARPGRRVLVTDDDNFPTDRYVFEGLAAQRGLELRMIRSDIDHGLDLNRLREAVDEDTALVSLSHVAYRSGALLDMSSINQVVHAAGALVLWDLCHSAGAVPVDLDATSTDLAVGCTYKYLNGGPGAPAFLYVRRELQEQLRQPIWGWFGQRDQFAMGAAYDPAPGIERFLTGTPPIVAIAAVEEGVRLLAEAGIDRLRAKGVALTSYVIDLAEAWLPTFAVASPLDPDLRGSHVSLSHLEAWRIFQALTHDANVVPDYRSPDRIRLGPAPITTRFVDVWDALDRLCRIVESKEYERYPDAPYVI